MKAITLWQPWASQCFDRIDPKDIENRTTLFPPEDLLAETPTPTQLALPSGVDVKLRPFFAVHAGRKYDPAPAGALTGGEVDVARRVGEKVGWSFPPGVRVPRREELPYGAVVGVARVRCALDARGAPPYRVSVVAPNEFEHCLALPKQRWWLGPIGWGLMDAIPLPEPVPCKGALGVWTLTPEVEARVLVGARASVKAELDAMAYADAPHGSPHVRRMPWMQSIDLVVSGHLLGATL